MNWYYRFMGQVFGPVSSDQMRQLAGSGQLSMEMQFRHGCDGEWVSAWKLPDAIDAARSQEVAGDVRSIEAAVAVSDHSASPPTGPPSLLGRQIEQSNAITDTSTADRGPTVLEQLPALIVFAVVIPALLVITDMCALDWGQLKRWNFEATLFTYAWFVLQVGLVGFGIGRLLEHRVLRWVVFVWLMLLVDILLLTIAIPMSCAWWRQPPAYELAFSLLSAQVAALTVWAVLGGSPWRVRLPLAAIAVVVAIWFASTMDGKGEWQAAFWCQCVATACVGLAFWIAGYRVERKPGNGESTREAGEEERWRQLVCRHLGTAFTRAVPKTLPQGERMQFSIWHLFVWTTSVAIILGVLRLVDLSALLHFGPRGGIQYLSLGVGLSFVSLLALWAALGRDSPILRLSMLALLAPLFGLLLGLLCHFEWWDRGMPGRTPRSIEVSLWVTWATLAALFSTAILLIFRFTGYWLVRRGEFPFRLRSLLAKPRTAKGGQPAAGALR